MFSNRTLNPTGGPVVHRSKLITRTARRKRELAKERINMAGEQ